jgi:hypothetical protein
MNPALPIKQISKYNNYEITNNHETDIIELIRKRRAG